MPADSTTLAEEGAVIDAFLLVKKGVFDEKGIVELLESPARKTPPPDKPDLQLAACRNMSDTLSDLRAQVAANAKGAALLEALDREYGASTVAAYMRKVRENAEFCVRSALKDRVASYEKKVVTLRAADRMDDGNPVALEVTVDSETGDATFDFSQGTGPQVRGNWNAPKAVTAAAVMYCLRLLVGRDVPLNSGCLDPVTLVFQKGDEPSMLAPAPDAAVCAGNVLTSMRVTDVVLKAFGACAASQGCMNNFTFGNSEFGYYETIAGGSGAGPTWAGTSAVQVHMTNTRITDVEILEQRYPVLVRVFKVRRGSGGAGKHRGGDGVVREIEFLQGGIVCSLLTERRALAPFGLAGGHDGSRGKNLLLSKGRDRIALASKAKVHVDAGDAIRIETPGGGGFGAVEDGGEEEAAPRGHQEVYFHRTASTALGANAVDF